MNLAAFFLSAVAAGQVVDLAPGIRIQVSGQVNESPMDGLKQMMQMMDEFTRTVAMPARILSNPCEADQRRFQCRDAACLIARRESLSAPCAMLLKTRSMAPRILPMAMPSPVVVPLDVEAPGMGLRVKNDGKSASIGGISFTQTNPDGTESPYTGPLEDLIPVDKDGNELVKKKRSRKYEGPIATMEGISLTQMNPDGTETPYTGPTKDLIPIEKVEGGVARPMMRGEAIPKELQNIIERMLPQQLKSIFLYDEEESDEKEEEVPTHPCAREVEICTRETHSQTRAAIEGCLLKHYSELSAHCKCFVHQVAGDRFPAAAAASSKPEPPSVRVVAPAHKETESEQVPEEIIVVGKGMATIPAMPKYSKAHSFSCLLLMTAAALVSFLIVRRCIKACCCAAQPRFAAVVPPQQATITTIEPLKAAEIVKA